jgi:hypothetical protein
VGAVTNLPVALAPGMGLNGYFASIVGSCAKPDHGPFQPQYMGLYGPMDLDNPLPEMYGECESWGKTKLPWTDAMGAVFISGWVRGLMRARVLRDGARLTQRLCLRRSFTSSSPVRAPGCFGDARPLATHGLRTIPHNATPF